jgi:hypothetical protein
MGIPLPIISGEKNCGSCIYGVSTPMYKCGAPESVVTQSADRYETYTMIRCSRGLGVLPLRYFEVSTEMPLEDLCNGCPKLVVKDTVSCHLKSKVRNKDASDWCGQWREEF